MCYRAFHASCAMARQKNLDGSVKPDTWVEGKLRECLNVHIITGTVTQCTWEIHITFYYG